MTNTRITKADIDKQVVSEQYHVFEGTTVTVCCLTLQNGYNTVGTSACVVPKNFDAEIGKTIAKENALNEIWALEGYLLKEKLHNSGRSTV